MTRDFDCAVVIGRFQPMTTAHAALLQHASTRAPRVVVLFGSANGPRTVANPWPVNERADMLRAVYPDLEFNAVPDWFYNDQVWVTEVQRQIHALAASGRVCLVGAATDDTSWYLHAFPQYPLQLAPQFGDGHATQVRDDYFRSGDAWQTSVPAPVATWLTAWRHTDEYNRLAAERKFYDDYRRKFAALPFPPVFVTVDAVVVKSGHVLLVQRRMLPGQDLYALPGGFLKPRERIVDGILRELKEETGLQVPASESRRAVQGIRVFDHPDRSLRGRTITHCGLINLGLTGDLPRVKGGSDARDAVWVPAADLEEWRSRFFEDHFSVAYYWLSKV